MVTSETRLPDDPRRSGLLHEAIVVAGFELGSVVARERSFGLDHGIGHLASMSLQKNERLTSHRG